MFRFFAIKIEKVSRKGIILFLTYSLISLPSSLKRLPLHLCILIYAAPVGGSMFIFLNDTDYKKWPCASPPPFPPPTDTIAPIFSSTGDFLFQGYAAFGYSLDIQSYAFFIGAAIEKLY